MSEFNDDRYDFLRQLSTHQLEALLRADFEEYEQGNSSNDELVEKVLEVIEEREKEQPSGRYGDVDAAWERFVRDMEPASTPGISAAEKDPHIGMDNSSKPRRVNHGLRRIALVAAAIAICTLCAACAIQFNLFEMVGKLTSEFFHFHSISTDNNPEIQVSEEPSATPVTLDEALADYGVSVKLPPIPADYEQEALTILDLHEPVLSASYVTAGRKSMFTITVVIHETTNFEGAEANEFYEEYPSHGQIYSLFTNNEQVVATWNKENIELSIRGTVTLEEMKAMVDSI